MRRAVAARGAACLRRLRPRAPGATGAGPGTDDARWIPAGVGQGTLRSRRVLLVEDDAVLASVVARHLSARGHETHVVASAAGAARVLGSGFVPSIVVVDVDLAHGEGWDMLGDGRLGGSGAPRVVTASAGVRSSRLRQLGVAWFVLKPFALSVLVEIVEGRRPGDGATWLGGGGAAGDRRADGPA